MGNIINVIVFWVWFIFNMHISSGTSIKKNKFSSNNSTCSGPVQNYLRYNVSNRNATYIFPLAPPKETLVEVLCCDSNYHDAAEESGFFSRPDVDLFAHISKKVVFYDPVCGIPLFQAPVNRTFDDFMKETEEHGWPSFRSGEIFNENTHIDETGHVYSNCGTHLGDYLPDEKGDRYCIDLSCISGKPSHTSCSYSIQKKLRYNISDRNASYYLHMPTPPGETLAQVICCDSDFQDYAEPAEFFTLPDVDLFGHIKDVTTFYDPVCGLPLFKAPINRTLDDFKKESTEHGWPSFRKEEVFSENIDIADTGHVFSKCGTHLGDYMPDEKGDRYCIDLSCISGNPQK